MQRQIGREMEPQEASAGFFVNVRPRALGCLADPQARI